jgi:hypothetical protein
VPSPPRIGELLVESGTISHLQLSEALSAQREHGGRLGTNLVELGFIDEKKLAAVLARQLNLPAATAQQLERVDAATLRLLPAKTAERLRAVPLREDKGKLWVALADPTDARTLEQLEKAVGKPVRPMVAPELLLLRALEQHYQVAPRPRPKKKASRSDLRRVEPPRTVGEIGPIKSLSSPLPPPLPPLVHAPIYDSHNNPATGEVERVAAYLDEEEPPPQPQRIESRPARLSLRDVAAQMAAAASNDQVLDAALRFLVQDVQRVAALVLRGGELHGARGVGINPDRLRLAVLHVDESPLVAAVLASGETWLGRVFADKLGGTLVSVLSAGRDAMGMVLPIRIGKKPAGVIVGVNASLEAMRNKPEFDRLATKLDHALHISYLRRQLLED